METVTIPVIHTSVFGLTPQGGSRCPIVFDADKLSSQQMQKLSKHYAVETAFILAPTQAGADISLRYFVPQHEVDMCGHATVGAVSVLVQQKRITSSPINVETPLGIIPVEWTQIQGSIEITVEQFPPVFITKNPSRDEVASVLRISEFTIVLEQGPIQSVSTSRPKLMVPIREREILNTLKPDFEKLWALCDKYETTGLYLFTLQTERQKTHIEARQFPNRAGYNEDPATGVAACALGAYLTEHKIFEEKIEGWHQYQVEQGHSMGHPSIIKIASYVKNGQITRTQIIGQASILSEEVVMFNKSADLISQLE